MPSTIEIFKSAMALHQGGQVREAAVLYRQILVAAPDHPYALHGLGLVAQQSGRLDEARRLIERAIRLKPDFPEAYGNRGNLLRAAGQLAEAGKSYHRAARLRPQDAEAVFHRGALAQLEGDARSAGIHYRNALCLAPQHAKSLNNLGIVCQTAGRPEEALRCFRRASAISPGYAEAWYNRATVLATALGAYDQAIIAFHAAIALKPDHVEAYANLGFAQNCAGRAKDAENSLMAAFLLAPRMPEVLNNLGMACQNQGRLDDALACYQAAIALRPAFAEAHNNRGMALLALGRFEEGWREREWRWQTAHLAPALRPWPVPQWRGEPAAGRRILVHAEQGYGDSLQFCRYLPLLAARGLEVTAWVPAVLRRLMERLDGVRRVVGDDETPPEADLHCPMMSLPLAFGTTLSSIPPCSPYLSADPDDVALWRRRLDAGERGEPDGRRRVGLVWAGSARAGLPELAAIDRRRSLAPARLRPLTDCPGVAFIGLQKDGPPPPPGMPVREVMTGVDDFADTAGLIANLDLVISVDTAVAHLAAAMGKPVWLLNRFDGCWRWLKGRDDSPWYPTLRQFRQPQPDDWDSVIAAVAEALRALPERSAP